MGSIRLPVPQISPFLESEGAPPVDFKQWLPVFDATLELLSIQQPNLSNHAKNLLLFTHLGTRGCKIVVNSTIHSRMGTMSHEEFRKGVKELFLPRQSPIKALHDFHQRVQRSGEPVDSFFTDLQSLLADCSLPPSQDETQTRNFFLMVQLVEGCYDVKTKQDLLALSKPTLEDVLQHMRAQETARAEATAIAASTKQLGNTSVLKANQGFRHKQESNAKCWGCGNKLHSGGRKECPAYNEECHSCGNKGHFASVCRQKQKDNKGKKGHSSFKRDKSVKNVQGSVTHEDPILMEVKLSQTPNGPGRMVKIEADSGAAPSTIKISTARRVLGSFKLQPASNLTNYDGSNIKGVLGTVQATVSFGNRQHTDIFHVVKDGIPEVMGRNFLVPIQASIHCGSKTVKKTGSEAPYAAFPRLLSPDLGTFNGWAHKIKIKPGTVPRAVNPRPIPLCYREAAIQEIKLMDKQGIWEPVLQSEWAHPMVTVPKPEPGQVRITTDLTRLNDAVIPERYPIPRIKDLFLKMQGATIFSKLDLRKGYYHIKLDETSRDLTTTATPLGLRRYCRLPMGLTDSASVFQRCVSHTLADLPGVVCYIDDIIVYGKDKSSHDKHLHKVLQTLQNADFRLQPSKCHFSKSELPAFGFIISKDGIQPDPKNIKPILEFPQPTCVKDVQSYLGLINFFGEHISGLGKLSEPLRRLTRKDIPFQWSQQCQQSFDTLKQKVQNALSLHIFNPDDPTIITSDASDVAVGATLTQIQKNKEVPIACFNRTLSQSERNYSATEKEAYGVILALEHWEKLILGRPVLVRTDHQALISMLNKPKDRRQSSKFTRWLERLEPFQIHLQHVKGGENSICDSLSRIPAQPVKYLKLSDVQQACQADELFSTIQTALQNGWKEFGPELNSFKSIAKELKLQNGLLKLNNRVYLPENLRQQALQELHQGHPGIERLKRSLRKAYWWPGLSKDAETFVKECTGCRFSEKSRSSKPIPVGTFPTPNKSGELYNLDIAGPFHNGHYLVVLIDAMSNFPEILDTKDITSSKIIKWLNQVWSRYGLPVGIITDNGPQFISDEFQSYLSSLDIHHYLTPVYYPQENGRVEVFNRTIKHGIQAITAEGTPWEEGVERIITSFRHTPGEDNKTPAERFLSRPVRRHGMINLSQPYRRVHKVKKTRGYFQVGDQVLVRQPQVLKGLSPFTGPLEVQEVLSYYTFRLNNGKVYNARRLKLFKKKPVSYYELGEPELQHPAALQEEEQPQVPRRSSRKNFGVKPKRYSP